MEGGGATVNKDTALQCHATSPDGELQIGPKRAKNAYIRWKS
jgi:hypothetical protein